jgi:hypothetical protein
MQSHDPAILQAFLGHSDPRTSLRIYREVLKSERDSMKLSKNSLKITTQITTQKKKDEIP